MRDYRVMDKDGRSCKYVIETVETYVLGNRETLENTIITISYEFSMASNCYLPYQTRNYHSSRCSILRLGANTVLFYTRHLKRQKKLSQCEIHVEI